MCTHEVVRGLFNTIMAGVCEAAEAGSPELHFELSRDDYPEIDAQSATIAASLAAGDARIERIAVTRQDEVTLKFSLYMLADAAITHAKGVEAGVIEPGLKLEEFRDDARDDECDDTHDGDELVEIPYWLN